MKKYEPSPFALAPKSFAEALPQRALYDEDELKKVKIPGWRYDEIKQAVLRMYEKADAHVIPFPVFDIARQLGCIPIPYRSLDKNLYDVVMETSQDALSFQFLGSDNHVILYNDRKNTRRQNFTILHEIGHIELGHKEASKLAEVEANYFAGVALCPPELLEYHNITDPNEAADIFNISVECAQHRLDTVSNMRHITPSPSEEIFKNEVIERFRFSHPIQLKLFNEYGNQYTLTK